jgi:hypothetical protein
MQVHSRYEIDRAASAEDVEHPETECVKLDTKAKTLRASNGKILAIVPIERLEKTEHNALIASKVFRFARAEQTERDNDMLEIEIGKHDVKVGGGVQIRLPGQQEELPALGDAVPKYRPGHKGTHTVALDVSLLSMLAAALGAKDGKTKIVRLTCKLDDATAAIVVQPEHGEGAIGVLMPVAMASAVADKAAEGEE